MGKMSIIYGHGQQVMSARGCMCVCVGEVIAWDALLSLSLSLSLYLSLSLSESSCHQKV